MNGDLANRPQVHRRGTRFAIAASVRYREHGTPEWHAGVTINVSRSGVLFRAREAPPNPTRPLDFVLTLPVDGSWPGGHVRCTGHVVRTEPSPVAGEGHAVAVAIDGYALKARIPD